MKRVQGVNGGYAATGDHRRRLAIASSLAVGLVLVSGPATAQTAGSAAEARFLEDVVVTAQKREQSLQEVPIALSVVTAADIENRSINDFTELLAEMPNTVIVQNNVTAPRINIRGVRSATLNPGVESAVGMQIDDVFLGRPSAFSSTLIDVERVEVLRGPQGTLFGKNTIGGLINIVTRTPAFETEGALDLTYGNYDLQQARGYLSGPLIGNSVAGKISFSTRQQDGWGENRNPVADNFNGTDFWGVRGQLLGNFGEDSSWLLTLEKSEDDSPQSFLDVRSGSVTAFDDDPFDREIETDTPTYFDREQEAASLRVDWRLGELELVSVSAYRSLDFFGNSDNDFTAVPIFETGGGEQQEQFSQEFRLLGSRGDLNWLLGLFWFDQEQNASTPLILGEATPPAIGAGNIPGYTERADTFAAVDSESLAVFGSIDYRFNDDWQLVAGLRYTADEKDFAYEQQTSIFEIGGFPINIISFFAPPVAPYADSLSDSDWSGDISLTRYISDDMNVYFKYARGFKAGGFDASFSSTSQIGDRVFDAEYLDSFEVGYKSELADGRVRLNAALFYSDYEDKQETVFNGLNFVTANAAEAEIYGLELDLTAAVTSGLTLIASLGLQESEYSDFTIDGADNSGNALQGVPELTASLAALLDGEFSNGWGWLLRTSVSYVDESYDTVSNNPDFIIEDRTLVNARLALSSPSGKYAFALWGKNLFNEDYVIGYNTNPVLGVWHSFNEPRYLGMEFRMNFASSAR
jgi:iron complex outermembrane receptor protein